MRVTCNITLQPGDSWNKTITEAARAVLVALDGDENDTCTIQLITEPYEHTPNIPDPDRPQINPLNIELPPLSSEPEVAAP